MKSSDASYVISCHMESQPTTVRRACLTKESPTESIALIPRKPAISLKLNRGMCTIRIKGQLGERLMLAFVAWYCVILKA